MKNKKNQFFRFVAEIPRLISVINILLDVSTNIRLRFKKSDILVVK